MSKQKKSNLRLKTRKGFTLIELLVVMAILGILAVIGLGSFRSAQIKGRDAKRKHDLGQIQNALELFYNDNQDYPTTDEFPDSGTTWQSATGTVYLKEIPSDPKFGSYQYSSDGVEYRLYARLENENDGCFNEATGPCSAGYDGYDGIICGTTLFCNYQMTSPNIVLSP